MSRFGWAYVADIVTGSGGGTPGGSDKAIQFASGSTFSGSTNFTFDYNTSTVRLTGTLHADNLIVSSSIIYKSGSTKFGDDVGDTHQFTGSVYVAGNLSASTDIYGAASIQVANNVTATGGTVSSSLGFLTSGSVQSVGNITTTAGTLSASLGVNTAGTINAGSHISSTGNISSSTGLYSGDVLNVAGVSNFKNDLVVTGTIYVSGNVESNNMIITTNGFSGSGFNITDVQGYNVDAVGDDASLQFKSPSTGKLTGSSNLLFTGSSLRLTGTFEQAVGSHTINFAEGEQYLVKNDVGGNLISVTSATSMRNLVTIGNLDASKDTTVTIQGAGDDYLNITIPTSGTTADFTSIRTQGVTITGSLLMSGTSYISEVDYIDFDVSASIPAYKAARIFHDTNTNDLSYYLPIANQSIQLGQQTVVKVKNSTGSPILKGKLVRINGGVGDNPLITTASWENDDNSANTLGMLMSTVAHNDFGYVLLNGILTGINTDPATFTAGQVVYLSSSGDYTSVTPTAPKHTVRLGEVVRAHATVGSIFIKVDNGYELEELHNLLVVSASTGDLLTYNSSSAVWQNTKTLSGSYTIAGDLTITGTLSSSTSQFTQLTASNITVVSGTINSRGIPNVLPTSIRRTIQVFPGAGSMVNSMNPINNANDTPFTQAGTATQGFLNGSAAIAYSVVSSTSTYGITTPDVGSTKVLCTSQRGPSWRGTFRTGNDLTQTRIFAGFEEYAGDKGSDDPTNGYAHLSYSSVRGDTTFKMITRTANGVGTQSILDTGISASVSTNYYFDMTLSSGSYNVTLVSGSSTFVGSITSSLPNITASLGTCCAAKNTAAVSRNLSIYFLEFNDS